MNSIWITADTHYHHRNIVSSVSKFKDKGACRCFGSVEEHDFEIVKGINDNVKENDTLIHVGDWSFGGIEKIFEFRNQIICKNIHLVLGNHDHHIARNNKFNDEACQSLFSSVERIYDRKIHGKRFVFCHYAMRTWENWHKGSIMLYGHSHNQLTRIPGQLTMDVGVDSAYEVFGKYRPFHSTEILKLIEN